MQSATPIVDNSQSMSYHLEQGQIAVRNVIKVYFRINPGVIHMMECFTLVPRSHYCVVHKHIITINTLLELAHEQVHTHDTEDQPENKAD